MSHVLAAFAQQQQHREQTPPKDDEQTTDGTTHTRRITIFDHITTDITDELANWLRHGHEDL